MLLMKMNNIQQHMELKKKIKLNYLIIFNKINFKVLQQLPVPVAVWQVYVLDIADWPEAVLAVPAEAEQIDPDGQSAF